MRALALVLAVWVLGCEAAGSPPPSCPPCGVRAVRGAPVWGFADLHAHPAESVAYQHSLLWGGMQDHDARFVTPGDPYEAPAMPACDGSTHLDGAVANQVRRATRAIVFAKLAQVSHHPHGPSGPAPDGDERLPYASWPDASDELHEMMSAPDLRRAYDGGLRLLFASIQDTQTITHALDHPDYPALFLPSREEERANAQRQIDRIMELARANAAWMEVVTSSCEARTAIESGRLALVLSLEMDALSYDDILDFVDHHGVRHVIPIHLVDNDYGGCAVYDGFFNSHQQLMSPLFGSPTYYRVESSDALSFHLGRPATLTTTGNVAFGIGDLSASEGCAQAPYAISALCCPSGCPGAAACCASACRSSADVVGGDRNVHGLTSTGEQLFGALMDRGVLLDATHLSFRSTDRLLELAEARAYPVAYTHGGVRAGPGGSERALDPDQARRVSDLRGIFGLGTEGSISPVLLFRASGAGLATASGAAPASVRLARGATPPSWCVADASLRQPSPDAPVRRVQVEAAGECPSATQLYAQLTVAGSPPHAIEVAMAARDGGCGAVVCFGACDATACSVCSAAAPPLPANIAIAVHARDPLACYGGAPSIAPLAFRVRYDDQLAVCSGPEGTFAVRNDDVWRLDAHASDDTAQLVPVIGGADAGSTAGRRHVRLSVTSAPGSDNALPGATSLARGTEVCVRLVFRREGESSCPAPLPIRSTSLRCPEGTSDFSALAAWAAGDRYDRYLTLPEHVDASRLCGVDVGVLWGDTRPHDFTIGEVVVESVEDPIDEWIAEYLATEARFGPGRVALGTDFNGFATRFPFGDDEAPADDLAEYDTSATCHVRLGPLTRGGVTMRYSERGLATYGMMPDFLAALARHPNGSMVIDHLMQSAEGVLRYWEASEAAAGHACTRDTTTSVACADPP